MNQKTINRIKVVLIEKCSSSTLLAEKLDMNETTISRQCTNDVQPPLKTPVNIAEGLKIDAVELLYNKQK